MRSQNIFVGRAASQGIVFVSAKSCKVSSPRVLQVFSRLQVLKFSTIVFSFQASSRDGTWARDVGVSLSFSCTAQVGFKLPVSSSSGFQASSFKLQAKRNGTRRTHCPSVASLGTCGLSGGPIKRGRRARAREPGCQTRVSSVCDTLLEYSSTRPNISESETPEHERIP